MRTCSSTRTAWRHGRGVRRSKDPEGREGLGKVVVLAASCVETAHIMLNSRSRHWPTGIANSSGQLGRNLCDHLTAVRAMGIFLSWSASRPTPDNIADSTVAWMPRWQNPTNPREERFIRGYSIYMGGGCGEFPGHYRPRGVWPRFQARHQAVLPLRNRRADPGAVAAQPHQLRRHRSGQEGHLRDSCAALPFRVGCKRADDVEALEAGHDRLLKAAGGELWGADTEPNRAGTSLHETGVCRFGTIRRRPSRTGGRRRTMCRTCISAMRASSRVRQTRPPRRRSSPSRCAPAITCSRTSGPACIVARDGWGQVLNPHISHDLTPRARACGAIVSGDRILGEGRWGG